MCVQSVVDVAGHFVRQEGPTPPSWCLHGVGNQVSFSVHLPIYLTTE